MDRYVPQHVSVTYCLMMDRYVPQHVSVTYCLLTDRYVPQHVAVCFSTYCCEVNGSCVHLFPETVRTQQLFGLQRPHVRGLLMTLAKAMGWWRQKVVCCLAVRSS